MEENSDQKLRVIRHDITLLPIFGRCPEIFLANNVREHCQGVLLLKVVTEAVYLTLSLYGGNKTFTKTRLAKVANQLSALFGNETE